ncbi:MAG: glycine cleavage system protein H [Pseudomonadota bacterium]
MTTIQNQPKKNGMPTVFDMTSNQCVWSAAGVVAARPCFNAYDCTTCSFDKKLQRELAEGKSHNMKGLPLESWCDPKRYTRTSYEEHKCRHMLTGRVPVGYCTNNYNCARCAFDQGIDDAELGLETLPASFDLVAGFAMPKNYYFHRGHTWARVEYGGRIRVGVDDFALRLLGSVEEFALPELGQAICQDRPELGLRRGNKEAQILSPVKGVVVAVNPKIKKAAAVANRSPYDLGWLMVVAPNRLTPNLRNLFFGNDSLNWMEKEAGRLTALVTEETGFKLAATGGRVMEDIYGHLPNLGWDRLVHEFLLT